jgi:glycosyltransferase involved in cell wall biosynthesis
MSLSCELESSAPQAAVTAAPPAPSFNAYVHVAYGYDSLKWQKNWREGKILGLNEEFPYGYHHAAEYGASVVYSKDHPETKLQKLVRYGFRGVFGFDFFHAWRNRREILQADVVWTHTESQSMAILLLFALSKQPVRPKLIGQVVWLIDEWPRLNFFRKAIAKALLKKADILTFLSPLNSWAAMGLFPKTRVEFVKFGINTSYKALPCKAPPGKKIRVLSVGNDRHRDWPTLVEALKDAGDIELRLLTSTYKLRGQHDNISVVKVDSNEALLAQFEWADMLVLALEPNFHASGITVIEEAVILGLPIICTKVGGLEAYFQDEDILYITPSQPGQIHDAIRLLAEDDELRQSMIANAKQRMVEAQISSKGYAKRHVELSLELLNP